MDSLFLHLEVGVYYIDGKESLNPCFNGFTILTTVKNGVDLTQGSLNPCFNGFTILTMLKINLIKCT